jgi:hypothetical protein
VQLCVLCLLERCVLFCLIAVPLSTGNNQFEVQLNNNNSSNDVFYLVDRLCGLTVRVPGYRTEMYCVSCEVRTEFIYVI